MRWTTALSRRDDTASAVDECVRAVRAGLGGAPVSLVLAFFSPGHLSRAGALAAGLQRALAPSCLMGGTAAGVMAAGLEVEEEPALAVVAAQLPGVQLHGFHVADTEAPALPGGAQGVVLLAEPFSAHVPPLLEGLAERHPAATVVGGLVSGGLSSEEHGLLLGQEVLQQGTVGVALSGAVEVSAVVANGCLPVGPAYRVTKAEGNLLLALDGRRPLDVLAGLHAALAPELRPRLRSGVAVGVRYGEELAVRDLLGVDARGGGLALAALVGEGAQVQFVIRDAASAEEDVRRRLAAQPGRAPAGTLLFSCLGRGQSLYGQSGVETHAFVERYGADAPLGGFFGLGELASVAGRPGLHGYTSVWAQFRPVVH